MDAITFGRAREESIDPISHALQVCSGSKADIPQGAAL